MGPSRACLSIVYKRSAGAFGRFNHAAEIAILDTKNWRITGKMETYSEIDGMTISKK